MIGGSNCPQIGYQITGSGCSRIYIKWPWLPSRVPVQANILNWQLASWSSLPSVGMYDGCELEPIHILYWCIGTNLNLKGSHRKSFTFCRDFSAWRGFRAGTAGTTASLIWRKYACSPILFQCLCWALKNHHLRPFRPLKKNLSAVFPYIDTV